MQIKDFIEMLVLFTRASNRKSDNTDYDLATYSIPNMIILYSSYMYCSV